MAKITDLYGGGVTGELLQPRFETEKVRAIIQRRNDINGSVGDDGVYRAETFSIVTRDGKRFRKRTRHEWKVPWSVLYYWRKPIRRHQMIVLHPWYVTWRSPRSGRRLRKHFTTLPGAVYFIATQAQYVDRHASVVAKAGDYDIPPQLRGKLPKPWLWCPLCVQPRKFFRKYPEEDFYAMKKVPGTDKHGNTHDGRGNRIYEWKERKLRVLICKFCGCTNRNHNFRRSNQPWEKRKFKRGVTRAKRRRSSMSSSRRTRRTR